MKKIAVIGAGTMGNGIAHTFAQKNYQVTLIDVSEQSLEKALSTISKNLDRMVSKDKISESEKSQTLANIQTSTEINKDVLSGTDLVVEAATENLEIKLQIFENLDSLCPDKTILASNTSSILISTIAGATNRADKVIGMHFMNPVPIMKLVEVIKSKETSSQVVSTIMELSKNLDKVPVEVNDAPGFVANRILMPMINEAIHTLNEDISSIEGIDTVMILGMSHPMGPLFLADFIGLDVCLSILNVLFKGFNDVKYKPCSLLEELVKNGKLGVKSGEGFYNYSAGLKNKVVSQRFT